VTEPSEPDESLDEAEQSEASLAWEVPEIVGVAGLSTVALLAVGGLATGIARAVTETGSSFPPGLFSQEVWNAITFGSQWAGPVVAIIVLAVFVLCWWQMQAWAEATDGPADDDDLADARGHIGRANLMARWAMAALVLTAAGSIAGFIAEVGLNTGQPYWTIDLYTGASLLAVLVLLGTAVVVNQRLRHQVAP